MPTIAIVGASADRSKFGNKAVRAYAARGWRVIPVHPKAEEIEGLPVVSSLARIEEPLDRVTLYVVPAAGRALLDDVARLAPGDLFLNPGTSSPELVQDARARGIRVVTGCAIVAIGETPGDYP